MNSLNVGFQSSEFGNVHTDMYTCSKQGVVIFCVNLRLHTTKVVWNLGLLQNIVAFSMMMKSKGGKILIDG